jgi:hypothetical protein
MRIFVTGTGRCGSVTFSKACRHITNYTCGHETHTNKTTPEGLCGDVANWQYPDNHIEVSPQLVIGIPVLRRRYPRAKWVHLVRGDRDACARSLCIRSDMRAFAAYWFLNAEPDELSVAYAVYDTVRGLCESLLPDAFTLELERARLRWSACWEFLGARGDFPGSLREWETKYNATPSHPQLTATEARVPNAGVRRSQNPPSPVGGRSPTE